MRYAAARSAADSGMMAPLIIQASSMGTSRAVRNERGGSWARMPGPMFEYRR